MIMSAAKNDPLLQNEDGTPKLPKQIFAHGFFTIEGQKMSKSLGNVIDPLELAAEYPFDVVRYFFFREISFGNDGNFDRAPHRRALPIRPSQHPRQPSKPNRRHVPQILRGQSPQHSRS
jgi:hypothetical protein